MSIDPDLKTNKEGDSESTKEGTNSNIDNENNNSESLVTAEAIIQGKDLKTVVTEVKHKDQLRNKGFGETFNNEYILSSLETLYLLNNNKIKLQGKIEYNFPLLLNTLLRKDKKILSRYLIYRDLRSKGYVVKEGFGFGNDFRIYERGEYGKKPAKYVSVGINEGLNIKSKEFVDIIEQVENMGKDTVIAVIERRGEIIYYKTTKMSFFENNRKK